MRSKEVDYEKLINEIKQKLENFIPRRRVRRIYKQVEKILKQDGIIDDLEDDDVIPKSKIRDKIKEIESDGIWVTEDYYYNEELGDEYPIAQVNFSKEEMEDIVIDILKEILGE